MPGAYFRVNLNCSQATILDAHLSFTLHQAWMGLVNMWSWRHDNFLIFALAKPIPPPGFSYRYDPWLCRTPVEVEDICMPENLTAHYYIKCGITTLYWDLFYLSTGMSGQIRPGYMAAYVLEVQLLGCELQFRGIPQSGDSFEKELRFEAMLW